MPLRIGDLSLENLSGPVVTIVAKPKIKNIPTFLIFGEEHVNITKSCDETVADQNVVVDEQFNQIFTELDRIAQTEDVHFYAESFFDPNINDMINDTTNSKVLDVIKSKIEKTGFKGLLKIVEETKRYCYYNELKKKALPQFQSKCPFPNIKWQYNDIRNSIDDTYFQNIGRFDYTLNTILVSLVNGSSVGYQYVYDKDSKSKDAKIIGPMDPTIEVDEKNVRFFTKMWRSRFLTIQQKYDNFTKTLDDAVLRLNDDNETLIKKLSDNDIIEFLTYYINFDDNQFDDIVNATLQSSKIKKQLNRFVNRMKSIRMSKKKSFSSVKSKSKIRRFSVKKSNRDLSIKTEFVKLQLKQYLYFLKKSLIKQNEKNILLYKPLFHLLIEFLRTNRNIDVFTQMLQYIEYNKTQFTEEYNEKMNTGKLALYIGLFSFIVDIYFLLRSFKHNTKIVSSVIGYYHALNLISFFKSNSNIYDIYVFDNKDQEYRKLIESDNDFSLEFNNQCTNMNYAYDNNNIMRDSDISLL